MMMWMQMVKDRRLLAHRRILRVDPRVLQRRAVEHRIKMVIVRQIVQNHHPPHLVLVERGIKLMMNLPTMMGVYPLLHQRIVREVEQEFQGAATR
jgi:hypothetical protein